MSIVGPEVENMPFDEHPHETDPALLLVSRPDALSHAEIGQIEALECETWAIKAQKTRARELVYTHIVTRIEIALRMLHPGLYEKIMALMRCSAKHWPDLEGVDIIDAMPEIEYIVYDTAVQQIPGIERHVDNGSAITLIVMLSTSTDYTGGSNGFEPNRELRLQRGQAVLFRGEKCQHWISPVSSGRRAILQVELQTGAFLRALWA